MKKSVVIDQSKAFGVLVYEARKKLKLTPRALAKQVGISLATLQNLEAGRSNPSFPLVHLLCEHLKIDISAVNDTKILSSRKEYFEKRQKLFNSLKLYRSRAREVREKLIPYTIKLREIRQEIAEL